MLAWADHDQSILYSGTQRSSIVGWNIKNVEKLSVVVILWSPLVKASPGESHAVNPAQEGSAPGPSRPKVFFSHCAPDGV